ncbi:hypothetical protein FP828_08870 [bacterium]|nr:hypothetical protein [bacterium]
MFSLYFVMFIGVSIQTTTTVSRLRPIPHRIIPAKQDIIKWMNKNIPPGSVILCDLGFAPEIVLYSKFSTVIHTHYEAKDVRDKTKEFYESLFKDEDELWNFARKYKSDYILYHWMSLLESGVSSKRYMVNITNVFTNSAIYKLHFAENELKRFELLYQNEFFRLFRVLKEGEAPVHHNVRYSPFFNPKLLIPEGKIVKIEGFFDDDYAQEKTSEICDLSNLKNKATQLVQDGKLIEAEQTYLKIIEIDPYFDLARVILADFYTKTKQPEKALWHLKEAVRLSGTAESYFYMISACKYFEKNTLAQRYRQEASKKFPADGRFQ